MDNDKLCEDFLRNLKIAITNTSVYFKEHPIFMKSVEGFKEKVDQILNITAPLDLGIMPHSLIFNKEIANEEKNYKDVADFFHCRKIKKIEIRKGVTTEELIDFLTKANLSPKDIIRKGGLSNILKEENLPHILVEDLDYSQLLSGAGQECQDVWVYLLNKSFDDTDFQKISELTDKFPDILKNFKAIDLLENEETNKAITRFIDYLKNEDKGKFLEYSRGLAKAVLKSKELSDQKDLIKLKSLLDRFDAAETADVLLESFKEGQGPDSFNFSLFSKLVDEKKHSEVADYLARKLAQKDVALANPKVVEGIKKLVSLSGPSSNISQVYGYNLSALLGRVSLKKGFNYDNDQLKDNYYFVLLDLFSLEQSQKRLESILNNIIIAIGEAEKDKKIDRLNKLIEVIKRKGQEKNSLEPFLTQTNKSLSSFIENSIFSGEFDESFEYFIDILKVSAFDVNFYLDNIFNKNKVNRWVLRLFFKFFSGSISVFYEYLARKAMDAKFFEAFMDSLSGLDPRLRLDILKHIFSFANDLLKLEVLKAMERLKIHDEELLFSILAKNNFLHSKHALLVLATDAILAKKAAKQLLGISNPLGIRSNLIIENLKLINEVPFAEAKEYLLSLKQYRFFWNKAVRKRAEEVLERHYV